MATDGRGILIGNPLYFEAYPIEQALRLMKEFGFEGVEICHSHIAMCKTPELLGQFAEHVASLGLPLVRSNVCAADYHVPLRSKQDSTGIIEGLKRDVDIAASLGVRQLMTWEGRKPEGATKKDIHGWIFDETLRIFREAVEYASGKGISISVEIHPFTLGIDIDFAAKLCDGLPADSFGIVYDCCHFAVGDPEGYIEAISKLGSRIKHVHFADSDKRSSELHFPPGKGEVDLSGIVKALRGIDFDGTMMLDVYLYPLPEEACRIGVPYMKQVMKDLGLRKA